MTSSGLGWTDFGDKRSVSGFALEFYSRVKAHYAQDSAWIFDAKEETMWVFEPHVAEQIFSALISELQIDVTFGTSLNRNGGVAKQSDRIQSIRMLNGDTYQAQIFIDATYEGDLMAAAGVAYTVGRESNAQYGETLNGVQTQIAETKQFDKNVSAYILEGDPSSGILPGIAAAPGKDGAGDAKVQAYNFRLCMTKVPINRVLLTRPKGYDETAYELLARYFEAGFDKFLRKGIPKKFDPLPNLKTDTNNGGSFSTDYVGANWDYPDASYTERRQIVAEHETYTRGLFYFLSTSPRVPAQIRREVSKWGLCRDEFTNNNNWPYQIYVREARRMVSDFVLTQNHLEGRLPVPEPIAMGSYSMDSHAVQRYAENGFVRNGGAIEVKLPGPYGISYRSITPNTVENLLVPVALSASHIAYGSVRMEPVFMVLGQASALAASLAIRDDLAIQNIAYKDLRLALDGAGIIYSGLPPLPKSSKYMQLKEFYWLHAEQLEPLKIPVSFLFGIGVALIFLSRKKPRP